MISLNQRICGVARHISLKSLSIGTLTPRERGILAEIVVGHSSKEIARFLEISPRTVEFHRANLLKKVAAKNTADLVRKVSG
jgi:DNA-binding CsgD family transcriptional regulator